ncbi:transglutaminase-like domain-containing protein [Alkaliphilus hydrothermalis]|uniref:Transglutaminase-like putative cysteine protease n=1 Tax=Alkaliphilus hydrothermalis TaxID=1482730 RepID=A0ABS2NQ33_9FIRM|nr:transglutaminase-like domain-containing protein [Alkaliphilus hydrothermalis]MBM7615052.1 transglutaminase-like putative cysteine protease [Alkaliphilus hydrothermalis]
MKREFSFSRSFFVVLFISLIFIANLSVGYGSTNWPMSHKGVSIKGMGFDSEEGVVNLWGTTSHEKIKILIKYKDINKWLEVELQEGKFNERFWLTEGKGSYEIIMMIHKEDRKYSYGPRLNIENEADVNPFLVPITHIESDNEDIIEMATTITQHFNNDTDKAKAIFNWVTGNIKYDYDKYHDQLNSNYNHQYGALNTLKTKTGVCYDFATLTAALGRGIGLQVKVVEGLGVTDEFSGLHAWNEVYISEENRWISLDTTFSALSSKDWFDNQDFNDYHVKSKEY